VDQGETPARGDRGPTGEVAVPIGRDPITKRYSYAYEQAATLPDAEAVRDRMLADLEKGWAPKTEATFGTLIDEVLEAIRLDFTTFGMYQGYIERTIRPALAEYDMRHLEQHPELLDKLYARLGKRSRLYAQPDIRAKIERLRDTGRPPTPQSSPACEPPMLPCAASWKPSSSATVTWPRRTGSSASNLPVLSAKRVRQDNEPSAPGTDQPDWSPLGDAYRVICQWPQLKVWLVPGELGYSRHLTLLGIS
jgi:hypothetical protein